MLEAGGSETEGSRSLLDSSGLVAYSHTTVESPVVDTDPHRPHRPKTSSTPTVVILISIIARESACERERECACEQYVRIVVVVGVVVVFFFVVVVVGVFVVVLIRTES